MASEEDSMGLEADLFGPLWRNDSELDENMLLYLAMTAGRDAGMMGEDQEYMSRLTHYLMGIGGSIVCCLGTVANALSVAVLTRRAMRSSTYMYLTALAICDSLVLFFTLLLILKDTKSPDKRAQMDQFHAVLFPFTHATAVVFQVTSIWLTLAFTVDRYIMICHPFKAERMCRRSRARKVVIGLYIAGLLFNIPRYLEYYTTKDVFKLTNSSQSYTVYGIDQTAIGKNELFREIVHSWSYLICVYGIPFFSLVVLNGFLIHAVRLSRLKGKEINAREKHRNDTTIMLIGVIVIFLICQGPALVSRMIYALQPGNSKTVSGFTLNEVGSFLVTLNSAINIVPYYLFGRKFRSEFWRLFCTCFFDQDELRRIVRSYSVSMDHRRMSQYNVMELNGLGQQHQNGNRNNDVREVQRRNYQSNWQQPNGGSMTICHSDTADSVAIPLIHSTCNSIASAGQAPTETASKDLVSDPMPSHLLPSPHYIPFTTEGSGHAAHSQTQYMTVTSGPSIREPEWSAV